MKARASEIWAIPFAFVCETGCGRNHPKNEIIVRKLLKRASLHYIAAVLVDCLPLLCDFGATRERETGRKMLACWEEDVCGHGVPEKLPFVLFPWK